MSSNSSVVQFPTTTGIYMLRWSITNGVCAASTADITVSISAPPTTANAGGNHTICNSTTYTLSGNTPTAGTGTWTVLYKTSSSTPGISGPGSPTSAVTGLVAGNTYVFQWKTVNGGCTSTSNDTVSDLPPPTTATTSGNQSLKAATSATITGNMPTVGTGAWSQTSGPAATISAHSQSSTTVTGLSAGNAYGFRWRISNGVHAIHRESYTDALSALPIRLLAFDGRRDGNQSLLRWRTADEQGCDHYEVERSFDGSSFRAAG